MLLSFFNGYMFLKIGSIGRNNCENKVKKKIIDRT